MAVVGFGFDKATKKKPLHLEGFREVPKRAFILGW